MTDTVPVRFEVLGIERVHGAGRLLGLAIVSVELAGVELTLQGVQIVRGAEGHITIHAPTFKHPRDGRRLPAVLLPPELRDAVAAEVLRDFNSGASVVLPARETGQPV